MYQTDNQKHSRIVVTSSGMEQIKEITEEAEKKQARLSINARSWSIAREEAPRLPKFSSIDDQKPAKIVAGQKP
jgi:hypothetical protein